MPPSQNTMSFSTIIKYAYHSWSISKFYPIHLRMSDFYILVSLILFPVVYHNESNGLLFGKQLTFSGDHIFL